MFEQLIAVIAPVVVTAAIGYGWARSGRPFDTELVTALVTQIGTPCLVFASLSNLSVAPGTLGAMALIYAVMMVGFAALGGAVLTAARLPFHSYLPALMFGNVGNMGLPLAFFAFGQEGLSLAVGVFALHSILQFTVGIRIASGSASIRLLTRNPMILGVVGALPFLFLQEKPPAWLGNTTQLISGIVIPLMVLMLGVSLASLKVTRLGRAVALALLRLGGGFAVGLVVVEIFAVEGAIRGVLLILSAMPCAVFNYVFALRYKREPGDIAAAIVISTVLSFASLPLLLLFVL